eukprot:5291141-Prymnesium_polylepis.1
MLAAPAARGQRPPPRPPARGRAPRATCAAAPVRTTTPRWMPRCRRLRRARRASAARRRAARWWRRPRRAARTCRSVGDGASPPLRTQKDGLSGQGRSAECGDATRPPRLRS